MKHKSRSGISSLIITFVFIYSALLCHFHALSLFENDEKLKAVFFWFCGFTALLGALRYKIADLVSKFYNKSMK